MGLKRKVNASATAIAISGLFFIAAGASVPHEQTIAFGLFLLLSAATTLLAFNWPRPAPMPLRSNLVSLDAFRTGRPRRS